MLATYTVIAANSFTEFEQAETLFICVGLARVLVILL